MADNAEEIVLEARDAASEVVDGVVHHLGALGNVLSRLATAGGGIGIAFAGLIGAGAAAVEMGESISKDVDDLKTLERQTGVNAEKFQALRRAVEDLSGDSSGLYRQLRRLNSRIAEQDPLLEQLQIRTKDTLTAYVQLVDVLGRSDDTAKKTAIAWHLLGQRGSEVLAFADELPAKMKKAEYELESTGALIKNDLRPAAAKLGDESKLLAVQWEGAMVRMKSSTIPAATAIVRSLNDVWDAATGRRRSPQETQQRDVEDLEKRIKDKREQIAALKKETATGNYGGSPLGGLFSKEFAETNRAQLAEFEKELERLEFLLRKRKGLAREFGEDDINPNGGEIPGIQNKPDLVKNAKLDQGQKSDREKRLEEIIRLLGVGKAEGERLLKTLEAIEDAKSRATLIDALTLGPEVPKEIDDVNTLVQRVADSVGMTADDVSSLGDMFVQSREDIAPLADAVARINLKKEALTQFQSLLMVLGKSKEEAALLVEQILAIQAQKERADLTKLFQPTDTEKTPQQVGKDWVKSLDDILSFTGKMDDTLHEVYSSMQSGFKSAMDQIVQGTATATSIFSALWGSAIDAVEAELARLAAAAFVKWVGTALGLPGFAATPAAAAQAVAGGALSQPAQQTGEASGGVTNISIYSYDMRDGVRTALSPGSPARRAARKIAILGET